MEMKIDLIQELEKINKDLAYIREFMSFIYEYDRNIYYMLRKLELKLLNKKDILKKRIRLYFNIRRSKYVE